MNMAPGGVGSSEYSSLSSSASACAAVRGVGLVGLGGTVEEEAAVAAAAGPVVGIVGGGAFSGSPAFLFGADTVEVVVVVGCGGGRFGC